MKKKIVLRGDLKPHFSKMTDVLRFGKHKNETIDDVLYLDPGYLLWMEKHDVATLSKNLRERAEYNQRINDAHRFTLRLDWIWRDDI